MANESNRPHTYRHESMVARIIMVDQGGKPTGDYGTADTFILIDGLWYSESSIKAGGTSVRKDQLKPVYDREDYTYTEGEKQ